MNYKARALGNLDGVSQSLYSVTDQVKKSILHLNKIKYSQTLTTKLLKSIRNIDDLLVIVDAARLSLETEINDEEKNEKR